MGYSREKIESRFLRRATQPNPSGVRKREWKVGEKEHERERRLSGAAANIVVNVREDHVSHPKTWPSSILEGTGTRPAGSHSNYTTRERERSGKAKALAGRNYSELAFDRGQLGYTEADHFHRL